MPDKRRYFALCGLVLAASAYAPQAYAARLDTSWGNAGVSFNKYRADAISCGRLGANADIADNPSTRSFVAAERWNDRNLNGASSNRDPVREQAMMVQRLNPAKRLAEVQAVHLSAVEACLTKLGYRRFRLTREQTIALRKLRLNPAARHVFLHGLASDPAILAAQSIATIG